MHSKDVGSSPVAFHFFLFNLLVYLSLFFILCRHGHIYLKLAYVYSTNTHVETGIVSISRNVITLTRWVILILVLSSADLFKK